ncbi:MAG: hypothetical protein SPL35_03865 [Bacteroidales bacterium]|nr:hypothetical protein [Bacteroidales bacterium]
MTSFFKYLSAIIVCFMVATLSGCSLVDDNLDNCDSQFSIDYQLRLETNITTELQTELDLQADLEIRGLLEEYLKNIFADYAKDVDLSFYNVEEPMPREKHMVETMNASESSYTLTLPVQDYRHLAVANIKESSVVKLKNDDNCKTSVLSLETSEEMVPPHNTGIFTARKDIHIESGKNQHFDVRLFMANSASALVLDMTEAQNIQGISAMLEGFATEFNLSDSTYVYGGNKFIGADELTTNDGATKCFASVHFPSDEIVKAAEPYYWDWRVYVKLDDGTITESVIKVSEPILPGHLKVLKAEVKDTGVVTTDDMSVGISITLDWHRGIDFPVVF